jgi:hypothetical protein
MKKQSASNTPQTHLQPIKPGTSSSEMLSTEKLSDLGSSLLVRVFKANETAKEDGRAE